METFVIQQDQDALVSSQCDAFAHLLVFTIELGVEHDVPPHLRSTQYELRCFVTQVEHDQERSPFKLAGVGEQVALCGSHEAAEAANVALTPQFE